MGALEGKVAVITGGNSGIGLATARRFVKEGSYVFITGRRQAELDKAVSLIGKNVTAVQGDVSELEDLDHLYEVVRKEKGRVDVVFANAGVVDPVLLTDSTPDTYDSRYVRRLYDPQHRMIAAKWRNKSGEHSSLREESGSKHTPGRHQPLPMNGLWDQDLSTHAFSRLGGGPLLVHAVEGGYELTTIGPLEGRPQLISATLVLDRRFQPVREIMRIRAGSGIHELRFVQTEYEYEPSASVPDATFDPEAEYLHSLENHGLLRRHSLPGVMASDVQLAELQIAVLYQLNALRADTGEPIEVVRTPDGHIRISGTVADAALKEEIVSHLQKLNGHQLLDLRLISTRDMHLPASHTWQTSPQDTSVYDINQTKPVADAALRKYFQEKGLSGKRLDDAVGQFSRDALQHAQHALQHAYALDRLGSALSAAELESISPAAQEQWTEMVHKHASDLPLGSYGCQPPPSAW